MITETFSAVTLTTQANVYFDGKCVSHSFTTADGSKKAAGVVLPSTLTFNTGAAEIMEWRKIRYMPVENKKGELVGLLFDGNIHSISGSYWFDTEKNRAVAVDTTIIREALTKVYPAAALPASSHSA